MSLMELPDKEFIHLYLRVIATRLPTESEKRRYENCIKNRPRISIEEHSEMMKRLNKLDKQIRIKKVKSSKLRESDKVDWNQVEAKVEEKQVFDVRMLIDGEEVIIPTTGFTYEGAKKLAIQAAYDNGATFVKAIT